MAAILIAYDQVTSPGTVIAEKLADIATTSTISLCVINAPL